MKANFRNLGKYVKDNTKPIGMCDYTGFMFNTEDLCKQMIQTGNAQTWSGLMVGRPFLDPLQEQNKPPPIKNDPQPVQNARPFVVIDEAGNVVINSSITSQSNNEPGFMDD